jgi:3',5'-nucleoside bisphosphate phosphatase
MMRLAADMHIHTVLSPCASREMTPAAIVREAVRKGLAVIAVCDHNSAGNVDAVTAAAAAIPGGPTVIAGIEITTGEEAHVLGFFPDPSAARAAGEEVTAGLPPWRPLAARTSVAAATGGQREPEQELVDAQGKLTGIEMRMLAAASRFTLSAAVDLIHRHGGLAVAAHVDRKSFSVPGQLGFLPPDVPFDGLEISAAGAARGRAADFLSQGVALLSSSDSHFLEDIGAGVTLFDVEAPVFPELRKALLGVEGRGCAIA